MQEQESENGFDRIDRKIGTTYSRALAWIFLIPGGLLIAYKTLTSDTFTLSTHWPGLAASVVLLFLARLCFKSREGMLSMLSDVEASKDR